MARVFLRVVSGSKQGVSVPLREDQPLLIGRVRGDLRLDDPLVSQAHCRVVWRGGHFVLQDLGSTNGTLVDGRRVQDVVLRPGCEIVVGNTRLLVFGAEEEGAAPAEPERDAIAWLLDDDAPDATLTQELPAALVLPAAAAGRMRVLAGPDKGREFPLTSGSAAIGRGLGDVPLSDPEVSRRHALVEVYGPSTIFLRDLGSTNGTYHNGRRVQTARLRPGDTVGCGKTVMKFV